MVDQGTVLAVCRVHALLADQGSGVTAIDKRPVTGPVKVQPYGLFADVQADRKNHGGLHKAVYAYSQSDADFWAVQLGREVPPGLFGENLRLSGVEANSALIGEQWQLGAKAVVEVTMPRTPCSVFQRRMAEPQWVKRFTEAARVGAYLRVLQTGSIQQGDEVRVIHRPSHSVTVRDWFSAPSIAKMQALQNEPGLELAPEYQPYFEKLLRRN
ncbi:MOSC domain-containing protein [Psychromicrobium lacuslunae]|uniref:Molybdenum cofactor sulfurase n=1 Tax=Psychromicrobium lacuslunae TaxID=1618207 RepID=A0A0D4BZE0_9MICC|nr:MOSC domain-containing protein [Psychromicrobium lacuslunae]AJT41812.1 molybdenum cofactor sulfurase [Psychromicrobium lacuslunae]